MRDPEFRAEQERGVRAPHVKPINDLVDRICAGDPALWAPYVAPIYGGSDARLLSVLRDPGPKTNLDHGGSGFLCLENDDATAERICGLFAESGIDASDVVPWNVYPWYINKAPTAAQLEAGVAPLVELIGLMPKLRVVMLHGGSAQQGWRKLQRRHPELAQERKITVIPTYHPSRQAFWHPDAAVRQRRSDHLTESFERAAAVLRSS